MRLGERKSSIQPANMNQVNGVFNVFFNQGYVYIYILVSIIELTVYTLIVLAALWIWIYLMTRKIFVMVKGISDIPVSLCTEVISMQQTLNMCS